MGYTIDMSIENDVINRERNERRRGQIELSPLMRKAHERAHGEVLENPEYAIQMADFESVYNEQDIRADLEYVSRLEKIFDADNSPEERRMKQVADIFEAIVLDQAEMNEWFGDANMLKTTPFDDYKNKVDMIAEWFTAEEGSRVLALAVDVTFGKSKVREKLEQIRAEIDADKLGSVKYFKDDRGDFMGTRNNVPRTVVGVSEDVVEELAELWMNRRNKELATHPIQQLFVQEIVAQLTAMCEYAQAHDKPDVVLAYKQALAAIRPLKEKKAALKSAQLLENSVANEIFSGTSEIFHVEKAPARRRFIKRD
jgi:hypothetical protein